MVATEKVYAGFLDVAERVRELLRAEGIEASLLSLPFESVTWVEGAYAPAVRHGEIYVPLHARAAAVAVLEANRRLLGEWSGFPLEGCPVDED